MGWRESASCAAARPTAAPDAGTLPVRVGAGGAGEPASLPRRCPASTPSAADGSRGYTELELNG